MRRVLAGSFLIFFTLFIPAHVLASVGVGIGTGRIDIKENIKSGSIYTLPSVIVFNTGTQKATYDMSVTLNEVQAQQKPNPAWFSFKPNKFTLDAGKSQVVRVSLHPPLKTSPGDYFAYLEAHPDQTVNQGSTAVGVAAATKLSFTVKQSNFLLGLLYRILALYKQFSPWSYIITVSALAALIFRVLKRRLHLSVKITKASPSHKPAAKSKAKTGAKPKPKSKAKSKTQK